MKNISYITTLKNDFVNEKGISIESSEWNDTARELHELRMAMKTLDAKEKALKERLIALSEGVSRHNGIYLFQCQQSAGRLDYPQILKDYMVDQERYRKDPIISWKLSKI